MAELRRGKTKRKQVTKDDDSEKPTKEEYAVAKYLRFSAPCKEGKFLGNSVQYFIGSKAVDALMESKWSTKHAKTNALFTNRSSCEKYCERLLEKGFFHHVAKPEKREKKKKIKDISAADKGTVKDEKKPEKKSKKDEAGDVRKEKDVEQKDKKEKEKGDSKPGEDIVDTQKEDSGQEDKKRKKKKLKLEMHDKQIFIDSSDLYVWIYDPVPVKTFIIGLFLVLGAIAVCLFPLWPPEVKLGVYYLSLAGAGFIGVILSLCILRMILFLIVWLLTLGKVSFWLLPNLTEDVGFLDSFRPAYRCDFKDAPKKDGKDAIEEVEKDDATAGDGEAEGEGEAGEKTELLHSEKAEGEQGSEEEEEEEEEEEKDVAEEEEEEEEEEDLSQDLQDNGNSGSSNDNGYEIVDADDVEDLGPADVEGSDEDEDEQARQRRSKKTKTTESKKTK